MSALEHARRMHDLKRILQKINRVVIQNRNAKVTVTTGLSAPAGSKGIDVLLDSDKIKPEDVADLTLAYGLNYHEICHILYSPRGLTISMDEDTKRAYHILEDQRIERLFVTNWPMTKPYLTNVVARWVAPSISEWDSDEEAAAKEQTLEAAHMCTYGRRYLDKDMRDALRDAWGKPDILDEVEQIIDEYLLLVLPRDNAKAKELSEKLAELIRDNDLQPPEPQCSPDDNSAPQKSNRDQRQDQAQAASDEGQEGDGDGEGDGEDEEDGEGQEGDSQSGKSAAERAADAIRKAMAAAAGNEDVQREMKARQKAIADHEMPYEVPETLPKETTSKPPSPETESAARRFEEELQVLADQSGPAWDRATPSGRLNVMRAMDPDHDMETLFDRWEEEGEGHDLEVVSLVDGSGSMFWGGGPGGSPAQIASNCAWIIDRGIKSVEGTHTSFAFGSGTTLIYNGNDRVTSDVVSVTDGGGTMPRESLVQAEGILMASRRKNKLLIVVTDGEWSEITASEDIIERLRNAGVQTALAYIGGNGMNPEQVRHKCEQVEIIPDVSQLPKWAASVVEEAMRKKNQR